MPYAEIKQTICIPGPPQLRYRRLYNLLNRICLEQSADFRSDYATLFSRLIAVCRAKGIDHRPADRFRHSARLVLNGEKLPDQHEETADCADLCHFVYQLYGTPIPNDLPQAIRPLRVRASQLRSHKTLRAVVTDIVSPHVFTCIPEGSEHAFKVEILHSRDAENDKLPDITSNFHPGANVMLLDVEATQGSADTLTVYMAVVEPDYLIDVSALTACIKPYGSSPLNFLLNALSPMRTNRYILLGNLANQFMDDCVNGDTSDPTLYDKALRKNYRQSLLDYACCDTNEVNPAFFTQARQLFINIRDSVMQRFSAPDVAINRADVVLEPAFICPAAGLRGRLDLMTLDHHRVLELKSGKAEEYYGRIQGPKRDHLLQMTLYGEILRRNFGADWNEVSTFLFYAVYPHFFNERPSASAIRNVLHLRNGIVHLVHQLCLGKFDEIRQRLTPDVLNEYGLDGKFYENYLLPQIKVITEPLKLLDEDELLRTYFSKYVTFIEREMFMSKTSDNRPDSIRGFASTWTADTRTKLMAGNLLNGLKLSQTITDDDEGITALCFKLPAYDADFVPNFNKGEMVQIYEATDTQANVTNRQLVRGTVTEITSDSLTIELAYRQRNPKLFPQAAAYAVEHDASDSPSAQQLRNLFSLLSATPERRALLLGKRPPRRDTSLTLRGSYPDRVKDILLRAKQACDYFLLVGPPGTGKTNLALRSMVKEFLLERLASPQGAEVFRHHALMLTAYTNRAVDEICSMLHGLQTEISFDYLRIGSPQTCDAAHHDHLLSERAGNLPRREHARKLIDEVPIVVGTVLTLTNNQNLFRRKTFDCAIIDEASQLLEPQALGLLAARSGAEDAIRKFIFIGDHKQLPAVVMLPESQTRTHSAELEEIGLHDLRNSLFERLHFLESKTGRNEFIGLLHHQGRMHPDISLFVNEHFYNCCLDIVPLPHQEESLRWNHAEGPYETFVASTRMGFVPVEQALFAENLRANAPEAESVCHIVCAICALNKKNGIADFRPSQSIGIIVPFRSQIAGIRSALRKQGFAWSEEITIDTVECYQGSQRDYILFSTTISQPYQLNLLSAVQMVEGTPVDRKLNVAVTRARRQFFIFGSPALLNTSPIYRSLLKMCRWFAPVSGSSDTD